MWLSRFSLPLIRTAVVRLNLAKLFAARSLSRYWPAAFATGYEIGPDRAACYQFPGLPLVDFLIY